MNQETLLIKDIIVEDRQRLDHTNSDGLKESLKEHGTIQPIVVERRLDGTTRLLTGGRRLLFLEQLGHTTLYHGSTYNPTHPGFVYGREVSADLRFVFELEENIRRKDMSWTERVLNVYKIHQIKTKLASKDSKSWGQRETGEMLGESKTHINFLLIIARKLKAELAPDGKSFSPNSRYAKCDSLSAAWQLRLRDEEDAINAELAKRHQESVNQSNQTNNEFDISSNDKDLFAFATEGTSNGEPSVSLPLEELRKRYEANPHNKIPFDQYWEEREKRRKEIANTIYISKQLYKGDSIEFMLASDNEGRFDHIVTDIPYGIDIDNLDQQNPHGGMKDIDTIRKEHGVEDNLKLIADFFPAAFKCTKEKAFVITWADVMNWQFMYDSAITAGFAVQRWPVVWTKEQAMNQCATFNFTKDFEIAIVCRKKGSTLNRPQSTAIIHSGKDKLCELVNHPFAKPYAIWEFLLNAVSMEGQLILEPFAGRGSGVISMLRMKRNVVGVELNETHYNALLENVKQYYLALNPEFIFK